MQILIDNVEVLLVREAAQMANKTTATIYNWINDGSLQTKLYNDVIYVVKQSLLDYLEQRRLEG